MAPKGHHSNWRKQGTETPCPRLPAVRKGWYSSYYVADHHQMRRGFHHPCIKMNLLCLASLASGYFVSFQWYQDFSALIQEIEGCKYKCERGTLLWDQSIVGRGNKSILWVRARKIQTHNLPPPIFYAIYSHSCLAVKEQHSCLTRVVSLNKGTMTHLWKAMTQLPLW